MRDDKPALVTTWLAWRQPTLAIAFAAILTVGSGCRTAAPRKMTFTSVEPNSVERGLVGAWRARVNFRTGALAVIRDLEFMYVFNVGGTLTESSNYDSAPPVPPAYGVWHKLSMNEYEAKYTFFVTKPPGNFAELAGGAGWLPTGHGVLTERITLSNDGNSYKSTITYEPVGVDGKTVEGGGEGEVSAVRMDF